MESKQTRDDEGLQKRIDELELKSNENFEVEDLQKRVEQLESEDEYDMPESTFTMLTIEDKISPPFLMGISTAVFMMLLLYLALNDAIAAGYRGNVFGIPAGVLPAVRMAQYSAVFVGEKKSFSLGRGTAMCPEFPMNIVLD